MKKIQEFLLQGNYEIEMPENAKILTIQPKGQYAYIYAMVDPGAPVEIRKFVMVTTDEDMPEKLILEHVGSFQIKLSNWGEIWVYHVFEIIHERV